MDMGCGKGITAVRIHVQPLSFAISSSLIKAISSAFGADDPDARVVAHTVSSCATTAAPTYLLPSRVKLLPSVYQVSSVTGKGWSCRSSLSPCTWLRIPVRSRSGASRSELGSRDVGFKAILGAEETVSKVDYGGDLDSESCEHYPAALDQAVV